MSISLQTNVTGLVAEQNLTINNANESQAITRLTSGYRINSSADDAAGLAVANGLRSSVSEISQGVRNANDGLSALQIIDGGLNNISQILDRLKTLATQSASTTFTGDRNTLNNEFQSLLGEITQQASNIGLVGGGKFNVLNTVYIGGGNVQANSQVNIDLSGTQNQVDAAGLGLSQATVAAGGTDLLNNTVRLDAPGATFLSASATQTFTFNLYQSAGGAQQVTATVIGSAAGLTEDQVLTQLNGSLNQYGIQASLGSSGQLEFGGGTAFTVKTTTADATDEIATTGSENINAGLYSAASDSSGIASAAPLVPANETLTFQNGQGTATVSLANTDTLDAAIAKINAQTAKVGVYAVKDYQGTGITLQSAASFTVATTAGAGTGVFGVGNAGPGQQTVVAPSSTSGTTGNALAAITAITDAVSTLGQVQGRVGAGENKLNYAIGLANSQIANFSGAESHIRDADVATEASNLTKSQVLSQASVSALAQANALPQQVLKLLQQ
ncbi:MAG TPA: flagellin [Bryobacteraceae bacterium]|nr:flagellin [Bryobacteraceae bacterium]